MVTEETGAEKDILIVEDDISIARLMEMYLSKAGLTISGCEDGDRAIRMLQDNVYRLVILDRMLPGRRGMEILRWMRRQQRTAHTPVLMVTALGSTDEKVHGLKEGADDYLPKPFEPAELVARVHALLRRSSAPAVVHSESDGGGLVLDEDAMEVSVNGRSLELRPLEFKLLQVLMKKPGKVRSREYLLDHVWGVNSFVELRTVDVTIKRLRKALDERGLADVIRTVRGAGYRFNAPDRGDA